MAAAAAAAEVVVAAEDDGRRALRFVLLHLRGVFGSRRAAVRAFHHAEIVVNGTAIRDSGRILHQGDKVEVRLDAERIGRQRDALDLPVVHEDVYIAVVWKGAGITETELQAALPYAFPESDVPTVCDCPDKNTYGLCLVAKDERTAGVMRAAVDASKLIRQSRVVVHGTPANTATALSDSVRCCCCVGCAPCCPLCGTATDAVAISPEQRRPPCDGYHVSVRHSTPTTSEAGVLSTCDVWWRSGPAATTIRRRFADAGQHIVGTVFNAKPTRGTSHKGGLYHAIVGLHFEHPVTREAIHVQHAEPAKFERMREREVMFLERARAQRDAELRDHGAAQGLEADDPSVPVAYVTGKKDFCGLVLKVTSNVLVPRASTAALVDAVQQLHGGRGEEQAGVRVLDLGTGSGGILLAILARLPGAEGAGIDVSEDAIALAQENASLLGLSGRASFAVADFGKLCAPDAELPQPLRRDQRPFDVVVCNPPYLPSSASMARASVAAEPALALYGGPEGLSCYRTIARSLASRTPPLLSVGGYVMVGTSPKISLIVL